MLTISRSCLCNVFIYCEFVITHDGLTRLESKQSDWIHWWEVLVAGSFASRSSWQFPLPWKAGHVGILCIETKTPGHYWVYFCWPTLAMHTHTDTNVLCIQYVSFASKPRIFPGLEGKPWFYQSYWGKTWFYPWFYPEKHGFTPKPSFSTTLPRSQARFCSVRFVLGWLNRGEYIFLL